VIYIPLKKINKKNDSILSLSQYLCTHVLVLGFSRLYCRLFLFRYCVL